MCCPSCTFALELISVTLRPVQIAAKRMHLMSINSRRTVVAFDVDLWAKDIHAIIPASVKSWDNSWILRCVNQ